jgi:glycerol dehydrogenase
MLHIKIPEGYISEPGAIHKAGAALKPYGSRLYIIAGKTALEQVSPALTESLSAQQLTYQISTFAGYPSETNFQKHIAEASAFGADLIVGIGGGRVCDTAKVVADRLELPAGTIPTIAATCAAWAAGSILYNDQGAVVGGAMNRNSPKVILADTDIILHAPVRYLRAGIIDTLAKWYETAPNLSVAPKDTTLRQKSLTAQLAYDILTKNLDQILSDAEAHRVTPESQAAVDAVIYLAGLVGSLNEDVFYGGFAHVFYNHITHVYATRGNLHGERVAVGLLIQFVLQKLPQERLDQELEIFRKLKQPLTFGQIGVPAEEQDDAIAQTVARCEGDLSFISFLDADPSQLTLAFQEADRVGKQYLGEGGI